MLYQETREEVLKYAVKCLENGLIHGTAGNVSARVPGEEAVVITPSGIPYDTLSPEDLPVVSLHAEIIDGNLKPSSETPMHTAIYRARPNVNGVVHTHSMFATVFSILEKEIPAMMPPSSAFAPVPCAPFQLPGSEELAESVVKTLGTDHLACTMQGHGQITACPTLKMAYRGAECVEEDAEIAYWTLIAGRMVGLPADAVAELRRRALKGQAV